MKFAGFEKSVVDNELLWVVRHSTGYRFVGNYEEMQAHCKLCDDDEYDYIKDIDLLHKGGQTPDMQRFMDSWDAWNEEQGFTQYGKLFKEV